MALQIAYESVDPPMSLRLEYMIAQLTSLFFNANRDPKKSKPLKPSDFMISNQMEDGNKEVKEQELNLKHQLLKYQAQRDRQKGNGD